MKILTISDGSGAGTTGGSNVAAAELASQIRLMGHEAVLVAGSQSASRGAPSNFLLYDARGNVISRIRSMNRTVCSYLANPGCDVVHSHFALYDFSMTGSMRKRTPFLRTFHGPWDLEAELEELARTPISAKSQILIKLKKSLRYRVEKRSLELADQITVLSRTFKDLATSRYGISADKIKVVPGGVDQDRFKPSEDRARDRINLGLDPSVKYILSIRRLVPRMGLDLLVEAMPKVLEAFPNAVLLIGGKGPMRPELDLLVHRLGLESSVRFLGFVSEEELPVYYRCVDLFAMPSRALEGFGLVTLEALSSGTPVAATPIGGNSEILGNLDPGMLSSSADAESLADCIVHNLHSGWSIGDKPAGLSAWVKSRYSWVRHAEQVSQIYRSMIDVTP